MISKPVDLLETNLVVSESGFRFGSSTSYLGRINCGLYKTRREKDNGPRQKKKPISKRKERTQAVKSVTKQSKKERDSTCFAKTRPTQTIQHHRQARLIQRVFDYDIPPN